MISAILLAAGESQRMGEFKQLLMLDGKSFVEHCVDNLLASRAGEVLVITGHRDADVRRAIGERPVRFAHNDDYRMGMSASVKRGVQAITDEARACLVALVDQPQISTRIINRVIDAYLDARPLIVVPTYDGRKGHPIILDLQLKDEILAMDAAQGLRQVITAHASDSLRVEVADDAVLMDCDFPEDYARLLKR